MTTKLPPKAKLYWACRRGMLELDLLLLPFFEACYDSLTEPEKHIFVQMLEIEDPTLYQWFIAREAPEEAELKHMVEKILAYARRSTI